MKSRKVKSNDSSPRKEYSPANKKISETGNIELWIETFTWFMVFLFLTILLSISARAQTVDVIMNITIINPGSVQVQTDAQSFLFANINGTNTFAIKAKSIGNITSTTIINQSTTTVIQAPCENASTINATTIVNDIRTAIEAQVRVHDDNILSVVQNSIVSPRKEFDAVILNNSRLQAIVTAQEQSINASLIPLSACNIEKTLLTQASESQTRQNLALLAGLTILIIGLFAPRIKEILKRPERPEQLSVAQGGANV